ncbi:hypothetical protein OHW85_22700, partial [Acinetobacter baumannii]|nr:hypothetical protein [Acinetobacter baumannii]
PKQVRQLSRSFYKIFDEELS